MLDKGKKGSFTSEDFSKFVGGNRFNTDSVADQENYKKMMEDALGKNNCTFPEFKLYMSK